MRLRLSEVKRITGSALEGGELEDLIATGLTIDSREVQPGFLFGAFKGEFLDGHDYVNHAFDKGASAAIVERAVPNAKGPLFRVHSTLKAITDLAGHARDVVDPIVVGITGSTGKTSTRDLLAAILSRKFRTVSAARNFNTEIGVPLTLLRIAQETEVVVCEMGARGPGQIRDLCEVARPQVGIVTNVGLTHFEQFGSREAIAGAKAELVRSLPEGGSAVLNADDELVLGMARYSEANVITFGQMGADVRVSDLRVDSLGRARFRLAYQGDHVPVELQVSGLHQVDNAAAAAAAGVVLGLSLEDCRAGLEAARISPWRMEIAEHSGVVFVNDAYNSSPASAAAAVESCALMVKPPGRLIAILGYMAELGEIEQEEHFALGMKCAKIVDRLVVVGEKASDVAEGARAGGNANVDRVKSADDAVDLLLADPDVVRSGDVILVKGSRVAGLEFVVSSLCEGLNAK